MRISIYDRVFTSHTHEVRALTTAQTFHDWFTVLSRAGYGLPDDSAITFTQGDHRSDTIISFCKPYRVLAIVDWEKSG
ncbi:phosphotransferase enzyme family protein [Penicillium hordei]|uniref:Phosphotransferase enzyme family protein n=1 Tax=Penicillium hordei TaxID=40994 RepID=A0AAD6EA18_9EURO|nr:phosphotransferase enzyme family protein [Penicillium hordei]KAJ5606818.1 phosphotransferase enzyme family protein [Penicillium hordei]